MCGFVVLVVCGLLVAVARCFVLAYCFLHVARCLLFDVCGLLFVATCSFLLVGC